MENNLQKICNIIGTALGRAFVSIFMWSFLAMCFWDIIAYEFNLPTFSYWTFLLFRLIIIYWKPKWWEN